jgi:DNA-binding transcriptional LysR family regulator
LAAIGRPRGRSRPRPAAAAAVPLAAAHQLLLVASTLLYFSCKSFHHEPVDARALSHHLASYSADYVNLRADSAAAAAAAAAAVQMEGIAPHRPQPPPPQPPA